MKHVYSFPQNNTFLSSEMLHAMLPGGNRSVYHYSRTFYSWVRVQRDPAYNMARTGHLYIIILVHVGALEKHQSSHRGRAEEFY